MIKVLVVDDHALFREGLVRLLSAEVDMEVQQCGTAREAGRLLQHSAFDVVLLDFDLGYESARVFVEEQRRAGFPGKVLIVTAGLTEAQAADMRQAGASGIILKHESPESLCESVRRIAADSSPILAATSSNAPPPSPKRQFTERDREVMRAVLEGLANKEIATRLGISESAVKASLQILFAKLGVRSRSQLVRVALEECRDVLGRY